jgi:hypothetical protein
LYEHFSNEVLFPNDSGGVAVMNQGCDAGQTAGFVGRTDINELRVHRYDLPATPDDLRRFVLVGREKLVSVRAEIKAIDKLCLAQEVRDQKRDEARMLSEALLDAEVRLGELYRQIPKAANQHKSAYDTGVVSTFPGLSHAYPTKEKTIRDLGFTPKQAERFETLADHPDLVERVKAEARENDDLPTRSAVLSLAKYRDEKVQAQYRQIDDDGRLAEMLSKAVDAIERLPADRAAIDAMVRGLLPLADNMLYSIDEAIQRLTAIRYAFERGVR